MSIIKKEIIDKNNTKEEIVLEISNEENKFNKNFDKLKNESIISAKELLKKLLQNSLNNSLLKLESNSANHISSLKTSSKSCNDFTKLVNTLIKKVEEAKKKKEKEKKVKSFKNSRKNATEHHLKSRSRTIESNLLKFKSKNVFGILDNKKNNNLKSIKKINLNTKKLAHRTMTNFRLIEENKENINSKLNNRFGYNTTQNFRKNLNKPVPSTPRGGLRERFDKNLDKSFNQNDKIGFDSFTTKYNNNTKKIEYVYEKNIHSRTLILNPLSDIDERIEKYSNNKNKINKNKGILYKTDKKNTFSKLNFQLDKMTENKKNKMINNKISVKDKEKETNELQNIVKLVDDVNQNLNKILNENQGIKKSSVKEINKNSKINEKKQKNNNSVVNAIKEVNIKEIQEIENNKIKNMNNTDKIQKENIFKNDNKENDSNNYIMLDKSKNDNNTPGITKSPKIDKNDINTNQNHIKNNINIYEKYFNDNLKIIILKKNKSAISNKYISKININKLKDNKSYKNFKDIRKNNNSNSKKNEDNFIKEKINNKNEEIKKEKIINNLEIIKTIRNKMKESINKINKENKNVNNKKILNKDKKHLNHLTEKNEKVNTIKIIKENLETINSKIKLNKSQKVIKKGKNFTDSFIKKSKSLDKLFK